MKIGLLACDQVPERFRPIGGNLHDMFATLFPEAEIVAFDIYKGRFPDSTDNCDAYMCTGSKFSVYDEVDWIVDLQAFVRELYAREKVFVGVCFGHQMLGHALGGRVEKAPAGWCAGRYTFEVIQQTPWMIPFQRKYSLMMMCQDQIMELPPDSTVLAATADCPIGMVQVGPRMIGLQAHPEFPVAYVKGLLEERVEQIGATKVAIALDSLAQPLDAGVIAQWIRNFIKEKS